MALDMTAPTADCPYSIFMGDGDGTGGGRPPCCSPVPRFARGAGGETPGRVVAAAPPTCEIRQKRAGQDFALVGRNVALVADGHGRGHPRTGGGSRVINALRRPTEFWEAVAATERPIERVREHLRRTIPGDTINDGSTLALVRSLENEPVVETYLVGDSSVLVFGPSGELVHKSGGQCLADPAPQRAAEERGIPVVDPAAYFHIKTPDTFTQRVLPYLRLGPIPGTDRLEKLGMYSALGHWKADGSCALDPKPIVERFRLSPTDGGPTKFVVMSDGAADMLCEADHKFLASAEVGAADVADLVERRLAQKWRYQAPGAREAGPAEHVLSQSQNDDVSVAVWSVEYAPPL